MYFYNVFFKLWTLNKKDPIQWSCDRHKQSFFIWQLTPTKFNEILTKLLKLPGPNSSNLYIDVNQDLYMQRSWIFNMYKQLVDLYQVCLMTPGLKLVQLLGHMFYTGLYRQNIKQLLCQTVLESLNLVCRIM